MSTTLAYESATVGYGSPVVTGASLEVVPGELVGLIGPNGAGKTTLVRAVTGSASVISGEVRVGERPARAWSRLELARILGVLPQSVPATFAFSARQFVEMGRHARVSRFGTLGGRDMRAVDAALELTDTEHLADEPVDTLSGGDLQRLTLAQALAQEPQVLLLDEPTSHLDLNHRLQILDVVRRLSDTGMAVLAVFHDLDMAARYSDRLAVVSDGSLSPAGTPEEVLTARMLEDVFGVRAVVSTDPVTGSVQVLPVVRSQQHAPTRHTRVVVISGSGSGSAVMRGLVLAGFRVSAGALARGDTDDEVAAALDVPRVRLPPYGSMTPADEQAVERAIREADAVVICATPFGPANVGNLRAAARAGSRLVLAGAMRDDEDFTDGEASRLWRSLNDRGAATCDPRDVVSCLEEVCAQ